MTQQEQYVGLYPTWPASGRHILAAFTESTITVYQAYRPEIAHFAVEHQRFGGAFSLNRMSWIKPNFLWMMYRSGWAQKAGQEHILAIDLPRRFFDELLCAAVPSSYDPVAYPSCEAWAEAVAASEVRLQWDPDHDPHGRPLARRALQLGLRGEVLRRFAQSELTTVRDITPFVIQQRANLATIAALRMPAERVYQPGVEAACRVGLDAHGTAR